MTDDAATTTNGTTGDGGDSTQDNSTTDAGSVGDSTDNTADTTQDTTAAADAGSTKTAVDVDKTAEDSKPYWAEDWRTKMAGEDKKELEFLQRYTSPESLFKAHRELQQKMSSSQGRMELPKNPTDDELAAYREGTGVPKTPEDYDTTLSDGLVIGDDDKPAIDGFLKIAHENNMTTDQAKNALEWYYKDMETQLTARRDVDDEKAEATRTELKEEWGRDFEKNINIMSGFFGEEKWDQISNARLADGTPIMSDKKMINFFAEAARSANPTATMVGAGGSDPAKSIEKELNDLRAMMPDPLSDYNQPAKKEAYRARLVELVNAQESMNKK